jgi:hypothetical protein
MLGAKIGQVQDGPARIDVVARYDLTSRGNADALRDLSLPFVGAESLGSAGDIKLDGGRNRFSNEGYFGWVKFELEKGSLKLVKKMLDESPDVLRHLIIKTVKENTLLNGKMKLKSEDKAKKFDDKDEEFDEVVDASLEDSVSEGVDKVDEAVIA